MSKLEGKVAAITGGNSGLGLAIAKRFSAEGAAVAIMGRNSETLESAVAEIGEGTVSSRGDVQSLSDLDEFFSKISEHFGSLDIVFLVFRILLRGDIVFKIRVLRGNAVFLVFIFFFQNPQTPPEGCAPV